MKIPVVLMLLLVSCASPRQPKIGYDEVFYQGQKLVHRPTDGPGTYRNLAQTQIWAERYKSDTERVFDMIYDSRYGGRIDIPYYPRPQTYRVDTYNWRSAHPWQSTTVTIVPQ